MSLKAKKTVAPHVVGPPCECTEKCYEKVGTENVKKIFGNYWGLQNMHSHITCQVYMSGHVKNVDKKRVRVKGHESRRKVTREYSVLVNSVTSCMYEGFPEHACAV